ncbi:MAG: magnetosome magnetite formation protein MamP [Rhodospirillaceae bacterium]
MKIKQETLISVTILTVVTVVVIGVWTSGFGLFKHTSMPASVATMVSIWSNEVSRSNGWARPQSPPTAPADVVNGFTPSVPTAAQPLTVGAGLEGELEAAAPKPPNFVPDNLQLYEAHWQGMDTRLLTSELRRKLRFPKGLTGIVVGEVTLAAARSGLLGGDVIIAVENQAVTTLENFQEATRTVATSREASIAALRRTGVRDPAGNRSTMVRLNLVLTAERELGFAQVEAAPMIKPGDPRPHPDRGVCTQCHAIGTGFELAPDPDLITLPPPMLSRENLARGLRPHEDRGPCQACHVVTP